MNNEQIRWTQSKCDMLRQYLDQHFPLTDEQWESVANYIEKIVDLSKGNPDVRTSLFDTVGPYQKKAEEILSV